MDCNTGWRETYNNHKAMEWIPVKSGCLPPEMNDKGEPNIIIVRVDIDKYYGRSNTYLPHIQTMCATYLLKNLEQYEFWCWPPSEVGLKSMYDKYPELRKKS